MIPGVHFSRERVKVFFRFSAQSEQQRVLVKEVKQLQNELINLQTDTVAKRNSLVIPENDASEKIDDSTLGRKKASLKSLSETEKTQIILSCNCRCQVGIYFNSATD